jgi:hypothetical protein
MTETLMRGGSMKRFVGALVGAMSIAVVLPVSALATPVSTSPPTISGAIEVGSMLTCSPGAWTGTNPGDNVGPIDYSWYYSTDLTTAIFDGGSDNTYTPVTADLGKQLVCSETEEDLGLLVVWG